LAQWYAIERGGSAPGWFAISRATVRHDIAWRCQYLAQRVARDDTLAHRFGDAAVLRLGLVATVDAIEQALMTLSDFATEQHLASRTLQQVVSDYGETRPHMPDGRPVDLEERRRRLVES
jgi:AraC-like DNA-binding protein